MRCHPKVGRFDIMIPLVSVGQPKVNGFSAPNEEVMLATFLRVIGGKCDAGFVE